MLALGYNHMGLVKDNKIILWGSDFHGKLGPNPDPNTSLKNKGD